MAIDSAPPRTSRARLRLARNAAAATLMLSLAVASSSLATTWGASRALTAGTDASMWSGGLGIAGSTLSLVYRQLDADGRHVVYRRSTDGGVTWRPPVEISRPTSDESTRPSLSVNGANIDVVWVEGTDTFQSARLVHRRSTDSGTTWGPIRVISPPSISIVGFPTVAASGLNVLVAYSDWETGAVSVRRSADGGVTWQNRLTLGTSTNDRFGDGTAFDGQPDLAFGTGVVYAVWYSNDHTVLLRRSFNGGATWTPPTALETKAEGRGASLRIAAAGSSAMIGYQYFDGTTNSYAAERRTSDSGSHWVARARVSTGTNAAWTEDVIRAGGKWRIVYAQCLVDACDTGSGLWYRDSATATSWSTASRFGNHLTRPEPYGTTMAYAPTGKVWIAWAGFALGADDGDIYIRSGQ